MRFQAYSRRRFWLPLVLVFGLAQLFAPDPLRAREGEPVDLAALLDLGRVFDFKPSPEGDLLAYLTRSREGDWRFHLIETGGKQREILALDQAVISLSWSPDGRKLGFITEVDGRYTVCMWERAGAHWRAIPGAYARGPGTPDFAALRPAVFWFPDSAQMAVRLAPETQAEQAMRAPETEATETGVFRPPFLPVESGQPSVFVRRANFGEAAERLPRQVETMVSTPPSDIAIIDTRTDQIRRVARDVDVLRLYPIPSPAGRHLAYNVRLGKQADDVFFRYDLHVIDVDSGRDRVLLAGYQGATTGEFFWSPDSRQIVVNCPVGREEYGTKYAPTQSTGARIMRVPLDSGAPRVYAGAGIPVFNASSPQCWSPDGRGFYSVDYEGNLWRVDLESGRAEVAAAVPGRKITRLVPSNGASMGSTPFHGDRLLLMTQGDPGTPDSIWEYKVGSSALKEVFSVPATLLPFATFFDSASETITYCTDDPQSLEEIWRAKLGGAQPQLLRRINARFDARHLGRVRLVAWPTADGETIRGALVLPPGHRAGQKLPLLVHVYGGSMGSSNVKEFDLGLGANANPQVWATRGYAVLFPDTPLRLGRASEDLVRCVVPGIDHLVSEGLVDAERVAIFGYSHGAFSTLALITQSDRFKAAMIGGVADPNLFAGYLTLMGTGTTKVEFYETGQGRIGGTPWEKPDEYRRNSPIFDFPRITTPVLIGQGELDRVTAMTGANTVFVALRRLGKPVEYRLYEGEGHAFKRKANMLDWWNRRLAFAAEQLDIALDEQGRVIMEDSRAKSRRSVK